MPHPLTLPFFAVLLAAVAALPAGAQPGSPHLGAEAGPVAYVGGQWYDGEGFAPRDTIWADRGVFVAGPLERARVVDLGGTFVVPPFGDAHYHGFSDPATLAEADIRFVAEGVFYVQNPNNRRSERDAVRGMETVVDVVYANGGITAPGAHPIPAYERQALDLDIADLWGPRAAELRASRVYDGDAYHLAATVADLDAVWPDVLAERPDLVKVYLNDSHQWASGPPEQPLGLDPAVVAEIVRRAGAAGLRVVAHVETAADARAALDAGVRALAHAPGYGINREDPALASSGAYVLDDGLLRDLAAAGVAVTPTLALGLDMVRFTPEAYRPDEPTRAAVRRFHSDLYRRLAEAGVPLAIGADSGSLTARDEAAYAVEVDGLTPAQALRAWAVDTPRAIFPDRAIGQLAEGFEASLLALACDPTADFDCTGQIAHREKEGVPVGLAPRFNPGAPASAYVGGQWWTGSAFVARDTTWAQGGVFVPSRPADWRAEAGRVVDLGDRWVVPPYGDAHTHMLSDRWQGARQAEQFEREGVLYVLVVTDRYSWATGVMDQFEGPGSIDVAYSHGGWTSQRSHPVQVYEWQALGHVGRAFTDEIRREIHGSRLAEDDAYFEIASVDDIDAKWATFLSHRPDVVKVYVMDAAAEFGPATSGMTGLPSGRGLAEEALREVVRRAHAVGLRVLAHTETGADVRLAVEAGVDGFVHMPGYAYREGEDAPYLIGDATIRTMGERGMVMVPTSVLASDRTPDRPTREAAARDLHRRQLRALHAAGARLGLGADRWNVTSAADAAFWVEHGFFPPATVLDLWTRTTPQIVFPGRAVGRLTDGYEASLLALDCDPLADWSCTSRIAHREKQGARLGDPADDLAEVGGTDTLHVLTVENVGHNSFFGHPDVVRLVARFFRGAPPVTETLTAPVPTLRDE